MDVDRIKSQLEQIYSLFPNADFLATTSRRTPEDVEALVEKGLFRYKVIASREKVNPIPDFLAISDYVFVTEDSTSMISEAVSSGEACVEVLPLERCGTSEKVARMIAALEKNGHLHHFDGETAACKKKINLKDELLEAWR